jgi:DNA repair protein RecO (recombination protein O)
MSGRFRSIVLRRINYGEADRIVDILTPDGQISAIAKGARREKSKLAGGIELLAVSDITIHDSKSGLAIITSARMEQFFSKILEDYDRLQFAYSAIKLVAKASKDIDGPEWFAVLEEVLEGLNKPQVSRLLVETWFFVHYAELLGDELNTRSDSAGELLVASENYLYDDTEKVLRLHAQGTISGDHIKLLRLIAAKPLAAVSQVGGIDEVLPECWSLARRQAAAQ